MPLDEPNMVPKVDDEIASYIRGNLKVMNLGCGNSTMSEDMYDAGYHQISNMDISNVCIE